MITKKKKQTRFQREPRDAGAALRATSLLLSFWGRGGGAASAVASLTQYLYDEPSFFFSSSRSMTLLYLSFYLSHSPLQLFSFNLGFLRCLRKFRASDPIFLLFSYESLCSCSISQLASNHKMLVFKWPTVDPTQVLSFLAYCLYLS